MKKTAIILTATLILGLGSVGASAASQKTYSMKKVVAAKKITLKKAPALTAARASVRLAGLTATPPALSLETATATPAPTTTPSPAPAPTTTPAPAAPPAPDANALLIAKLFELVNSLIADKKAAGTNVVTTVNPTITVTPTITNTIAPAPAPTIVIPQAPAPVVIIPSTPARIETRTATVQLGHIETEEHHG